MPTTGKLPERVINSVATFLSTTTGFMVTFIAMLIGIAVGVLVHFDNGFMSSFNIFLSVAAIVISGIILVSGARSEAALHVKLDHLIEFSKASNAAVGIEHKGFAEIESERKRVEQEASDDLDDRVEDAVEEEVTEQLDERGVAPEKTA
jgi:low affinity Fe/Cu permease